MKQPIDEKKLARFQEISLDEKKSEHLKWTRDNKKLNKFIDTAKSKPHVDKNGKLENPNGLPYSKKLNKYLLSNENGVVHEGLKYEEYEVKCKVCGLVLVQYKLELGDNGRTNGFIDFLYTQHLLSYRKREDGLVGLECICGLSDTRLSTAELIKYPDLFPNYIPTSDDEKAEFGSKGMYFECYKLK